ncbi:MAG TPA: MFS transporter [Longimicrobiaceae bacterium]|nr:MFS transporter [Longimicrobiaceae bacterium]
MPNASVERSPALPAPDAGGRLFYGWVLVGALALTETISYGILAYAFPVFLAPMEAELGWSGTALTGAFSLAMLVSGLAAIPAGRWVDHHGARALMTFGSVAAALLVLAWSRVESLAAFYLIWAGIGVTMAAVLYEPAFAVIATWFVRYRGRALTVLTFLAGFASVIFIPLAAWLVAAQGWRAALVTLAGVLAVGTVLPHALLLRRGPRELGLAPDGRPPVTSSDAGAEAVEDTGRSIPARDALRSASFRWLTAAFAMAAFAGTAILVHLIPYLTDRGYSAGFAAAATGMIGIMAPPGRLIFTPLGGFWPRPRVTAAIFGLQALGLLALLVAWDAAGVWVFLVLFGAGFGAITPARAALIAEYYGPTHYGAIGGALALALALARALAPVGTSVLHDAAGGYPLVLGGLALVSALAALAVLRVAPRSPAGATRRVSEVRA